MSDSTNNLGFTEDFFLNLLDDPSWKGTNDANLQAKVNKINGFIDQTMSSLLNRARLSCSSPEILKIYLSWDRLNKQAEPLNQKIRSNQPTPEAAASLLKEKSELFVQGLVGLDNSNIFGMDPKSISKAMLDEMVANDDSVTSALNKKIDAVENSITHRVEMRLEAIDRKLEEIGKFKAGLDLQTNYGSFVSDRAKSFQKSKWVHYVFFIISLIFSSSISGFFVYEAFRESINWSQVPIRIAVVIPIIWLAKFFHEQYTLGAIGQLRFENMSHLLGGGLESVTKYIESESVIEGAYKKFGDNIVDISDLTNYISSKKFKPNEIIDQAKAMIKIANELRAKEENRSNSSTKGNHD